MNKTMREVVLAEAATVGLMALASVALVGLLTRLIIAGAPLLSALASGQLLMTPVF